MMNMYDRYLALGEERTLLRVAQAFSKSLTYIKAVAAKWKWTDRVDAVEREAAQKAIDKTEQKLVEIKARKLKIIRALDARIAAEILKKTVKVTPGEFERLAKLELLIEGEATDRHEITHDFAHLIDDGSQPEPEKRDLPKKQK